MPKVTVEAPRTSITRLFGWGRLENAIHEVLPACILPEHTLELGPVVFRMEEVPIGAYISAEVAVTVQIESIPGTSARELRNWALRLHKALIELLPEITFDVVFEARNIGCASSGPPIVIRVGAQLAEAIADTRNGL